MASPSIGSTLTTSAPRSLHQDACRGAHHHVGELHDLQSGERQVGGVPGVVCGVIHAVYPGGDLAYMIYVYTNFYPGSAVKTREIDVLVSEVGPRDGLQSVDSILPLSLKTAWVAAEAAAGVREIEVGSFVQAKLLPQLADTADVVRHAKGVDGLTVAVLVPNLKGARAAIEAGADKNHLARVRQRNPLAAQRAPHPQPDDPGSARHRRADPRAAD